MKKILKWGLIALVVLVVLSAAFGSGSEEAQPTAEQSSSEPREKPAKGEPSPEPAEPEEPAETSGQANARAAAEQYLDTMPFSQEGLTEQLVFEGYSKADAAYGARAVGADWMEQAERAAEQYLDTMPFSRDGLVEQLVFEGFTEAQARHGADAAL